MLFETLVLTEAFLCLLLVVVALQTLCDVSATPELDLGQRAWAAARFSMAQAGALGPLFKHLVGASRGGLQLATQMQGRIRDERDRRSSGLLRPVWSIWQRRRTQRSPELAELTHLVEQLEQMGAAIARYRAGAGKLLELEVPLQTVQHAASEHKRS
ncbi:MAG TPA: hypothetical protein VJV78_38180 [Polyangiales bacterium]|nr:hypothetical protein [Polyangiales bacterium]